jgi:hypothetical protein
MDPARDCALHPDLGEEGWAARAHHRHEGRLESRWRRRPRLPEPGTLAVSRRDAQWVRDAQCSRTADARIVENRTLRTAGRCVLRSTVAPKLVQGATSSRALALLLARLLHDRPHDADVDSDICHAVNDTARIERVPSDQRPSPRHADVPVRRTTCQLRRHSHRRLTSARRYGVRLQKGPGRIASRTGFGWQDVAPGPDTTQERSAVRGRPAEA